MFLHGTLPGKPITISLLSLLFKPPPSTAGPRPDVFQYAGAGIEKVMEIEDKNFGGSTNPIKCYLWAKQDS